jgi:hypothetical protein
MYQASETAWHTLCNCGTSATLRFRRLAQHFCLLDSALCSRCRAARCMNIRAAQRIKSGRSARVTNVPILLIFYSILHIKKLPDIYLNCNNHCHTSHASAYLQLLHTQNQINPVYALLSFFYKTYNNIILSYMP